METKAEFREAIAALRRDENSAYAGEDAGRRYLAMHRLRFERTLELCRHWAPSPGLDVLDVGRSPLTGMLAAHYDRVSSLGLPLADSGEKPYPIPGKDGRELPHIPFDLTRSAEPEAWPEPGGRFDLIVYCETLEHMHIAPEFTLMLFAYLLKPDGVLLATTPNAVRLGNRARFLLGRNPFERIRFESVNPGHFREYTRAELRGMGHIAGLHCLACEAITMYPRWWKAPLALAPLRGLADNLAVVYRKPA